MGLKTFADVEKLMANASRSAINKMLKKARTEAGRRVRAVYNIKARDFNQNVKLRRARNNKLEGSLQISPRQFPVIAFGARQTKPGVTIKIKRAGGRKLIRSAFILSLKSGKTGVFQRKTRKRFPIKELFTADLGKMWAKEADLPTTQLIQNEFQALLEREIKFFFSRS